MEQFQQNKDKSVADLIAKSFLGKVRSFSDGSFIVDVPEKDRASLIANISVIKKDEGVISVGLYREGEEYSGDSFDFPKDFSAREIVEVLLKVPVGGGAALKLMEEIKQQHSGLVQIKPASEAPEAVEYVADHYDINTGEPLK